MVQQLIQNAVYAAKVNWAKFSNAGISVDQKLDDLASNTRLAYVGTFPYSLVLNVYNDKNKLDYNGLLIDAIRITERRLPTNLFFHPESTGFMVCDSIKSVKLGAVFNNINISFADINYNTTHRLKKMLSGLCEQSGGKVCFYFADELEMIGFKDFLLKELNPFRRIRGNGNYDIFLNDEFLDEHLLEDIAKQLPYVSFKHVIGWKNKRYKIEPADDFTFITKQDIGENHLGIEYGIFLRSEKLKLSVCVTVHNIALLLKNGFVDNGKLIGKYVILKHHEYFVIVPADLRALENVKQSAQCNKTLFSSYDLANL